MTSFDAAKAVLLVVGAYFLGSIPGAYVAGRLLKGIDLRQYGSGTVSGSMVYEHVARWAIVPVGLFDVGKVALPTWLGLRLGLGQPLAVAAGLAATIGHNWPIFLGFKGGRGIGGFVAILLFLFPWGVAWILVLLFVGWRLGDSAPFALAGLVTLPVLSRLVGGPAIVDPLTAVMTVLGLIKRLEANRRPLPPPGAERRRVVLRRLLLDRDIRSHRVWIDRRPDSSRSSEGRSPQQDGVSR
jgi:glycerol-3-phosphate acyltransferase PlsY